MTYKTLADVGHRLLVEPSGMVLTSEEKELLSELQPQSFIFRARNFDFRAEYTEWLEKFAQLLRDLRSCIGHKNLMMSIDHEGGRVMRPPLPITRFPYAANWGTHVAAVSTAMAIELSSLGLNTSWAPVADVLTNKESKAIGQRAFSDDPSVVTRECLMMMEALEANGIAAGAKHFPGYGAVLEDAHYDLPTTHLSRKEWEEVHLPPFVALIQKNVKFLMTAHIRYPALDVEDQATLSKIILSDILRDQLGYRGVVVADALGMSAIRDEIKESKAVEKALAAQLDLFCLAGDSVDLHTAANLSRQILSAVTEGRVEESLLDASRERIQTAIDSLPQPEPRVLSTDVFAKHAELARMLDPENKWSDFQYIPKGFD